MPTNGPQIGEAIVRWIRYSQQGRTAYGILEGERIREVAGDPFGGYEPTTRAHDLSAVKIEIPVVPPTFYCVGLNYAEHIKEAAAKLGIAPDLPKQPDVGYRAINALIAHDEHVIIPADASKVQYEGELAVVIGRSAKNVSESEALSCVLGYTIGNDVSERIWQKSDRTLWRAKNTDTFKPMGPWIETDVDLGDLETVIRVNGAGNHTLSHQCDALQRCDLHLHHEPIRYASPRGCDLDGHGRHLTRPEDRRHRRGGDRGDRHPAQSVRCGRSAGLMCQCLETDALRCLARSAVGGKAGPISFACRH